MKSDFGMSFPSIGDEEKFTNVSRRQTGGKNYLSIRNRIVVGQPRISYFGKEIVA